MDANVDVAATFRSPDGVGSRARQADVAATFRSPEGVGSTSSWRRRNNRLPLDAYVGANAYLVTTNTEGRKPRFTDTTLVAECRESLIRLVELEDMEVLAYVFMPDHIHLLLLSGDNASLPRFMKRFKQETGFSFKKRTGEALWQKGYHDHILRREEALADVASYIAQNPVRAGLVTDWESFPHIGGSLLAGARSGDLKVAATSTEDRRE